MSVLTDLFEERDEWIVRKRIRQRRRMVFEYCFLFVTAGVVMFMHHQILAGLSDLLGMFFYTS